MKILITGGAGFIGSHIADKLLSIGHDVVIVDNLSTGKKEYLNPKAAFYEVDVTNYDKLSEVFHREKPSIVNHHAAQVNVRLSLADPELDGRINVMGSLNVIKCAIEHGVKKIIFASTGGAIYGEPELIPVSEKAPTNPLSPYGVAKLAVEQYIRVIAGLNTLPYTILRYSNVYGPRQIVKGESGVIAVFTQRMLEEKKPVIFGDGSHTRDYVYVKDVVSANVLAMNAGAGGTYNIGTGIETDVNKVYDKLESELKTGIKPIHSDEVPGEVRHVALDCGLIRRELGWNPEYDLEKGVGETVKYYREII